MPVEKVGCELSAPPERELVEPVARVDQGAERMIAHAAHPRDVERLERLGAVLAEGHHGQVADRGHVVEGELTERDSAPRGGVGQGGG